VIGQGITCGLRDAIAGRFTLHRRRRAVDYVCTRCNRLKSDIWANGCDRMVRGWDFETQRPAMVRCATVPLEPVDERGRIIPFEELEL